MSVYKLWCFRYCGNVINLEVKTKKSFNFKKYLEKLNKLNKIECFDAEITLKEKAIFFMGRNKRRTKKIRHYDKLFMKITGYKMGKFQYEKYLK